MSGEKIKSCPFCGGEAEIKQTAKNSLRIRCKICLIGIKQSVYRFSLEWLRERMIENWNKRI